MDMQGPADTFAQIDGIAGRGSYIQSGQLIIHVMTLHDTTSASASSRSFARSLPMALLKAREAVIVRFRPALRARGLTEQQWRVLRIMHSTEERLRPMQLSQLTFISMPSLSRLLKTLEGRQLIKRGRHVADLRGSEFELTPQGRGLVSETIPHFEAIYLDIEKQLGVHDSEQLFRVLEHVEQRLGLPGEGELGTD